MKSYQYTYGGGILTDEQRQFYEDNGYIIFRNNVNLALLDEVRQRFLDICDKKVDAPFLDIVKDPSLRNTSARGELVIHKIQNWLSDDVLFKYTKEKAITDIISSITGPNITAVHSMLINKPPDADPGASLHPLHQDLYYFPFRPANRAVASWTAMEKIDENNGCLYVVPGTHTSPLYPHSYPKDFKNRLYHGIQGMDHLSKLYIPMEKGDSVFFHPLILHGSGPNRTKGFRKAISCHYADSNSFFIDVHGTIQEEILHEVEAMTRQKTGSTVKFVDYWKSKSRLVAGSPGNFQRFDSHL